MFMRARSFVFVIIVKHVRLAPLLKTQMCFHSFMQCSRHSWQSVKQNGFLPFLYWFVCVFVSVVCLFNFLFIYNFSIFLIFFFLCIISILFSQPTDISKVRLSSSNAAITTEKNKKKITEPLRKSFGFFKFFWGGRGELF